MKEIYELQRALSYVFLHKPEGEMPRINPNNVNSLLKDIELTEDMIFFKWKKFKDSKISYQREDTGSLN